MDRITKIEDVQHGLQELLKQDQNLVPVARRAGSPPLRLQKPGFEGLARIIIGQQVSRASASAIHARFIEQISPQTPDAFLKAGEAVWIAIGLSRAKQNTLSNLSEAILAGNLLIDNLTDMPAQDALNQLTTLKGIGPWTAEVYLLFSVGHPDIFPAGDLALQEGIRHAFNLQERPNEKETRNIAEKWKPLRGIAARLFWSYYGVIRNGQDALPL
ncbi:MAG: DNA-3-methyladenine glycosylase family protein [Rhizobiaceae bacterium]